LGLGFIGLALLGAHPQQRRVSGFGRVRLGARTKVNYRRTVAIYAAVNMVSPVMSNTAARAAKAIGSVTAP
jgi:hypothetical protein